MEDMRKIGDKIEIQELMARYNFALNFGDTEGWVACFTQDGIFDCPFGVFKGKEALLKYAEERTSERREHPVRHMVTNVVIDVEGEEATARCYVLLLQVTVEGVEILTTGTYNDKVRKMSGVWLFGHRKVNLDSKAWASKVFPSSYLEKRQVVSST